MTHPYIWHEPFTRVAWLIHTCDMTPSYGLNNSFIHVTRLMHMGYLTHMKASCHMYEWVMSPLWMGHVIHTCDKTNVYGKYDSFIHSSIFFEYYSANVFRNVGRVHAKLRHPKKKSHVSHIDEWWCVCVCLCHSYMLTRGSAHEPSSPPQKKESCLSYRRVMVCVCVYVCVIHIYWRGRVHAKFRRPRKEESCPSYWRVMAHVWLSAGTCMSEGICMNAWWHMYDWVMAHVWIIWLSHGTCMNDIDEWWHMCECRISTSDDIHILTSHDSYWRVMTHIYESCPSYWRVMARIWMRRAKHMNVCRVQARFWRSKRVMSSIWMTNAICMAYEWVIFTCMHMRRVQASFRRWKRVVSLMWMTHANCMDKSCPSFEEVIPNVWKYAQSADLKKSNVPRMDDSYQLYGCVMSRIRMSHLVCTNMCREQSNFRRSKRVTSLILIANANCMDAPCNSNKWVISHVWRCAECRRAFGAQKESTIALLCGRQVSHRACLAVYRTFWHVYMAHLGINRALLRVSKRVYDCTLLRTSGLT